MKVKLLEKGDRSIKFEIKDTTPAFVNAIRRSIMQNVSVMSVSFVDIAVNTSTLYNEVLAHRIGLIPLSFKPGNYVLPEKCECKGAGCNKCQVKLALKVAGPKNVYASNIVSTDETIKPVYKDTLLITLAEDQAIDLVATATLGNGAKHARWQPAVVGYQYYPEVKTTKDCDMCGVCTKKCNKKLLEASKGGKISLTDNYKCDLCNSCTASCPKDAIKIEGDQTRIIATVESVCGISPKEIVIEAVSALKQSLAELKEELK